MKCQKNYSRVHVESCTSALMAENFTLFAIEEEIAVQMPKNWVKRAKIQLDEWQLLFEEYVVD